MINVENYILYKKNKKGVLYMIVLLLLFGFVTVIVAIAILGNDVEGMRSTMQKINKNYENRKFLLINRCGGEYLLITENDTIVYGRYGEIKEIQIDDVMKIDIEYNIREKNTKRILTVVPTFEKTTSLIGVILNILTFSNDDFSNEFNVNSYEVDVRLQIDKFKYIVEEIKNKSETKNN